MDSAAEIVNIENCISGGFPVTENDGCIRVNLGTLQYGQSKDIIVPAKGLTTSEPFIEAIVQYDAVVGHAGVRTVHATPTDAKDTMFVERHLCRVIFAELIPRLVTLAAANQLDDAKSALHQAIEQVTASPANETESVKALLEDMCGQCTEALSKQDLFSKWGVHYLPSIMFAHRLQQCNNFKDPGVQHYGGKLFSEIRDGADDVFNSLPPPKPSVVHRASQAAPASMSAYNNCYGG